MVGVAVTAATEGVSDVEGVRVGVARRIVGVGWAVA